MLEPLGPYLDQSSLIREEDFYPETIAPFRWNGTLMCIPQNLSSLVVYYNKNLFDEAGLAYPSADWTWEGFLQTALALTKDTDGDGDARPAWPGHRGLDLPRRAVYLAERRRPGG